MKKNYFKTYENDEIETETKTTAIVTNKEENAIFSFFKDKFLDMNIDDILILVLIFILLTEDEPDMLTIAALGFIFLV